MGNKAKQQWAPPTITEFDIAERTQAGAGTESDGFDRRSGGGGDGGGDGGGGDGGVAPGS